MMDNTMTMIIEMIDQNININRIITCCCCCCYAAVVVAADVADVVVVVATEQLNYYS